MTYYRRCRTPACGRSFLPELRGQTRCDDCLKEECRQAMSGKYTASNSDIERPIFKTVTTVNKGEWETLDEPVWFLCLIFIGFCYITFCTFVTSVDILTFIWNLFL